MFDCVHTPPQVVPGAADRAAEPTGGVPFVALEREHAELADELRDCFDRVLTAGRFVLGEEVERFEAAWAASCRTAHCVGVNSGTAALALLLGACGVTRGDEVIVPAHTFAATALAVVAAGAVPVLAEVEAGTALLDPDAARAAVGPRTVAILAVHLYGQMCDMPALRRVAERHGLLLVEDAAQAHGAECDGRPPGGFGAGAAFSFYPSKNLGALGDAGAVCTDDGRVADALRQLRNLGQRTKGEHVTPGVNERLDSLQAALLSVKLPYLARANELRRRHAAHYRRRLEGEVMVVQERPATPSVHHVFAVRVRHRDAVAAQLRRAGIEVGIHYSPGLRRQPALQGFRVVAAGVPHADRWADEELSLPMSPYLEHAEVERVADACLEAVAHAG
jgi:dTDP-3-amino-3,4,6-trideoxy-alpha-D-glucose transaminase